MTLELNAQKAATLELRLKTFGWHNGRDLLDCNSARVLGIAGERLNAGCGLHRRSSSTIYRKRRVMWMLAFPQPPAAVVSVVQCFSLEMIFM